MVFLMVLSGCVESVIVDDPTTAEPTESVTETGDTGVDACATLEVEGQTVTCASAEVWCSTDTDTLPARLACCECDEAYCEPPPEGLCPEDPDPATPLPETCTQHQVGPSHGFPLPASWSFTTASGDDAMCAPQPNGIAYEAGAVFESAAELQPYVSCVLPADGTPVDLPDDGFGIDFSTHRVHLFTGFDHLVALGVYGDMGAATAVLDQGCPYPGGPPPPPVRAYLAVERAYGDGLQTQTCRAQECVPYNGPVGRFPSSHSRKSRISSSVGFWDAEATGAAGTSEGAGG